MSARAKNCMAPISGAAYSWTVMRTSISPVACFFMTEKKWSRARASEGSFWTYFQSLILLLLLFRPPTGRKVVLAILHWVDRLQNGLILVQRRRAPQAAARISTMRDVTITS